MTTGFGFCATCGTPKVAVDQKFCATCGATFAAAPPVPAAPAAPVAPPWAGAAPAAPVAPPPPPSYQAAPAPYQPVPYQGAPVAGSAGGAKMSPLILLIGLVVVVAAIGGFVYMNMSSKSGSVTVNPSTVSCSSTTPVTTTIKLPSSLKADDQITIKTDGKVSGTISVSALFSQQSDNSWQFVNTQTAGDVCTDSSGPLSMGTHTMQILDAKGTVLAEGSMTLQP